MNNTVQTSPKYLEEGLRLPLSACRAIGIVPLYLFLFMSKGYQRQWSNQHRMAHVAQRGPKSALKPATSHKMGRIEWVLSTPNCNKNILLYSFKIKYQTVAMQQLHQLLKIGLEKLNSVTQSWVIINANCTSQYISAFTSELEIQPNRLNSTGNGVSRWNGKVVLLGTQLSPCPTSQCDLWNEGTSSHTAV